jgi:hypothetical protein
MLAGSAGAATINDLSGLGYSVQQSAPGPADRNCPTYYVTGHGVSIYLNCDTAQSDIDSLANPATICNADWQINHPEQYAAFNSLSYKGYSISGDQCADSYTVTNPKTGATVYSGSGAGLPGADASNGPAPDPAPGVAAPANGSAPSNCLPLCPKTPVVIVAPAAAGTAPQPVTSSSAIAPITDPAVAPLAAAILFPNRSVGYLARAGYGTDGALAPESAPFTASMMSATVAVAGSSVATASSGDGDTAAGISTGVGIGLARLSMVSWSSSRT